MYPKTLMLRVARPNNGTVSYSLIKAVESSAVEVLKEENYGSLQTLRTGTRTEHAPVAEAIVNEIVYISEFLCHKPEKLKNDEYLDLEGPSYCLIMHQENGDFRAAECFSGTKAGEICRHLEHLMSSPFCPVST